MLCNRPLYKRNICAKRRKISAYVFQAEMRWEKIVNELCGKLSAQHKIHIKPLFSQQAIITNDVENV
jgi:hypothetical protein